MQHNQPWQVFAKNGAAIAGAALPADEFTEDYIMGAAHVWVWRLASGRVELLLQKRSMTKATWPGYFDVSAAGHIDVGETAIEAAVREAYEEIGLRVDPAELIFAFALRTPVVVNEIDHVFMYRVDEDFSPSFNDAEVEAAIWVDADQLEEMMRSPNQNNLVNQGEAYFGLLAQAVSAL